MKRKPAVETTRRETNDWREGRSARIEGAGHGGGRRGAAEAAAGAGPWGRRALAEQVAACEPRASLAPL
ncbi:unnamed protein product [Pieris brassicae]|uniref:Uncharacterized protein n=1 Tax=Pieris brassicae TaxID=7116 RepID=A0A9P0TDR2_PIEBR|nr:unnamed protein product [Pieris brassicae]